MPQALDHRPTRPPAGLVLLADPSASRAFSGEVVDARSSAPVAGARAALATPEDLLGDLRARGASACPAAQADLPAGEEPREGLSDRAGRFELSVPAAGAVWLLVHHPGYLAELTVVPAGARVARVRLHRAGTIRGRLVDGEGRPLAGALVRAFCPEAIDVAGATTEADGSFMLAGLRPGRWLIGPSGQARPGARAASVVDLAPGGEALALLRAA